MPAGDAAALILGLFKSSDVLTLERDDITCVTADVDYSKELKVLGALLDSGISAPVLDTVNRIQAGKHSVQLAACSMGCQHVGTAVRGRSIAALCVPLCWHPFWFCCL